MQAVLQMGSGIIIMPTLNSMLNNHTKKINNCIIIQSFKIKCLKLDHIKM